MYIECWLSEVASPWWCRLLFFSHKLKHIYSKRKRKRCTHLNTPLVLERINILLFFLTRTALSVASTKILHCTKIRCREKITRKMNARILMSSFYQNICISILDLFEHGQQTHVYLHNIYGRKS